MNKMEYKGYVARIEYDKEDRIFVGHLDGIKDIVGFHGTTVDKLEVAFKEAVDAYIDVSRKTGRPVQKPFSGRLVLKVTPEVHAAVANAAEAHGKTVSQWAAEILNKAAQSP